MNSKPETQNPKPRCILLCVGSELLRGKINTHASTIARRFASIGLELHEERTLADELLPLTSAIREALERFPVVVVTGGLGPTFDDLTREAAAQATGRALKLSLPLLQGIQRKFQRAHYRMPPANERQAYLLEGARAIPNPTGTAPGQWLELQERPPSPPPSPTRGEGEETAGLVLKLPLPNVGEGGGEGGFSRTLILLPGPPHELHPMLDQWVLPALRKAFPPPPRAEAHLHFVGVPESLVDHRARPIIARAQAQDGSLVQFTILAHLGLVDLDIFVSPLTPPFVKGGWGGISLAGRASPKSVLNRIVKSICKLFPDALYGINDAYPLEKVVGEKFRRRNFTVAVAESCTGGLLAKRLTDIPGSSDYFLEGLVTYANSAKLGVLGIPKALLDHYGAVSKQVAVAMAQNIRALISSTWGVGITGIAGPAGGTAKKPVGLVYIGLASTKKAVCKEYRFTGDRDAIRQRAVLAALDLLRQYVA